MKINSILFKSIAYLILVAIFEMHLCSVICATGIRDCNEHATPKKPSCCSHKKGAPVKDCQGSHLSFFNATGKFFPKINSNQITVPLTMVLISSEAFNISISKGEDIVTSFNVFHPPPLSSDIRIAIQSFLI